ncbi:MAG: redoxin domain-containing protein [Ignavibacteriales bacterium]|nr:redoxin domain-containing protein [Ignavibacteriales bacterium]
MELLPQQFRVPEIYGDYWLNSEPITLGALRGHVILIDFWDYTCVKCIRTLSYLNEWFIRYSDTGLILIGIHTPRFPFSRDPINVRKAVDKLNIKYPVVMDNDYLIWNGFRSTNWPTKILVDKNGFIRYVHPGEGQYQNFEHAIQSLLAGINYDIDLPIVMEPIRETDRPGVICYRETPEILTGWQRGTIGNVEGYSPESTIHYKDPRYHVDGRLYLEGDWFNDRNYLKLNTTDPGGGYLTFLYQAKEVDAVIKPEGEKGFQVFVVQDGMPISRGDKGVDIRYDEEGKSYFVVNDARVYNIVKNRVYGEHQIMLTTRSNGFAVYAISFVTDVIKELEPAHSVEK